MRAIGRLFRIALVGWAFVSAGAVVASRFWFREREGRGGPIPVSQAQLLLQPGRRLVQPVRGTLESFGLRPGDSVLELGPGPGYFTLEAASMVGPEGRVLCVDLQPGMLQLLRARLERGGVTNAHLIVSDATRLPLVDHSVDAAYLVTVLGEVPDRPAALAELRRVIKPGGQLSFAESLGDPDYVFVDTLKDLCRGCGFELREHKRQLLGYTMTFTAPANASPTFPR